MRKVQTFVNIVILNFIIFSTDLFFWELWFSIHVSWLLLLQVSLIL